MKAQSIYEMIHNNLNSKNKLPPGFELPREEAKPGELRFMVGARDGICVFHGASGGGPEKDIKKIFNYLKSGKTDKIPPLVKKHGMITIVDPLLSAIEANNDKFSISKISEYAKSLAFESADEELVKLGIALLGLLDWSNSPEMQQKLLTLGLYEEFTLYVLEAISWENRNDVIFEIAQNVNGWGKIHAVMRLEPTSDEIRDWILREGCSNAVLPAYLGLECAEKGNLIEVLRKETPDTDLYESICVIIDAMLDEGPMLGISIYEHAGEALLLYLQHSAQHAVTIKHLWHVLNVEAALESLELENKEDLQKIIREITSRPTWRELVQTTIETSGGQGAEYHYATNIADRLGL